MRLKSLIPARPGSASISSSGSGVFGWSSWKNFINGLNADLLLEWNCKPHSALMVEKKTFNLGRVGS